jgi:tRNA(fMet)-specific endonuclease VapC
MVMAYLLDTNIWINHLKNPGGKIEQRIRSVRPEDIVLCSIVKAELWLGAHGYGNPAKRRSALREAFFPHLSLPFDDPAAHHYSRIRYELQKAGQIIGPNDLKIAAIALHNDLTLVTGNTAEFRRVEGLKVEDWTV